MLGKKSLVCFFFIFTNRTGFIRQTIFTSVKETFIYLVSYNSSFISFHIYNPSLSEMCLSFPE